MKRIMLVGKISAGKTSLCQYLNNESVEYRKTQAIEIIGDGMIDTPGEYLEIRHMYRALVVTAAEADVIVLVQDAGDDNSMFAPQFGSMFIKPVVGVVTKSDSADKQAVKRAAEILKEAGAERIFITSAITGEGCSELYEFLNN